MNIILFDDRETRENLLPLSFTRPLADFRVGITTIREKWEHVLPGKYSYHTAEYLQEKYPAQVEEDTLYIAGNVCPSYSEQFKAQMLSLKPGQALLSGDTLVAMRGTYANFSNLHFDEQIESVEPLRVVRYVYDIFLLNGEQMVEDYAQMDLSDNQPLSDSNRVIGPKVDENGRPLLYIAPGAKVEGVMLNTTHGPIIIGRNAEVMEGSCLRGPISLGEHAAINMGSLVYPETTIGPWSKVGGEINNVVIFGYSNKAHDGFLGKAVIGEWCNLGAGCTSSNLKNNYRKVRIWNYPQKRFVPTDLQFCGLIMGDHTKAGINTMFNTATVVGVGSNIYGAGFPRTFIPSFCEGGAAGFSDTPLKKFFETAECVMARRNKQLTDTDRRIFEWIYNHVKND